MAARSDAFSRRRSQDESSCAPDRVIYFHIVNQQKVRVVNSTNPQLPALRYAQRDCAYYTTECTRNSRPNQEHRIRSDVIQRVKDILRPQVEMRKSDPSTLGFTFQARFGNVHFKLERQQRQEDIPTDWLKEKPAVFYFGIQFDAQHFIQGQCVERAVETDVRYKVTFTATTGNNEVVCTCHAKLKENVGGSFELVRVRAPTSVCKGPPWKKMMRFDIVRPAASRTQLHKRVDMRIVGSPKTQPVSDSDEVYRIAKEITSNMTRRAGVLSMHVLGDNFRVTFIRQKSMKTYTWKENPSWKIVDCVAYNCPDFDNKLEREQGVPYDVKFEDEPRKEIYFKSATYYTKPTGDPDVTLSTPDEYLSHLDEFVSASFHMAEMLEDTM